METQVDDIGSFPLPAGIRRDEYGKAYEQARSLITEGEDPFKDEFVERVFDMEMPDTFIPLPGCVMHKGKHYHYYGYASVNKHVYLETPCEEIHGKSSTDKNENGPR